MVRIVFICFHIDFGDCFLTLIGLDISIYYKIRGQNWNKFEPPIIQTHRFRWKSKSNIKPLKNTKNTLKLLSIKGFLIFIQHIWYYIILYLFLRLFFFISFIDYIFQRNVPNRFYPFMISFGVMD